MNAVKKDFKIGLIVAIGIIVTILHYSVIQSDLNLHILHRELYFLPILLAGFWFGLKAGAITSLLVSAVYAAHVFLYQDSHAHAITILSQIIVFILVGVLLGWLVDRQKGQQKKVMAAENLTVLGRAAATVGYEMEDLLNALQRLTENSDKNGSPGQQNAIRAELDRLNMMIDILKSYVPDAEIRLASHDLNVLTEKTIRNFRPAAQKAGITIEMELDEEGCPMMADKQGLEIILETLIKNALDVSSSGQLIKVGTVRDSQFCKIIVEDQGPGILPEHLSKIFTPFFTTKANGQGLALAVCKKTVTGWGGKIEAQSPEGKGAIFTVTIPREVNTQEMKSKIKEASRKD